MTRGRRREHYQWNMDIWGVKGIEAEAELLAAIVNFFESVGLDSSDVGLKVNSRAILSEVLLQLKVPASKHAATCVLIDKLEKIELSALKGEIEALDIDQTAIEKLVEITKEKSLESLEEMLGKNSSALSDIRRLFSLSEAYGYKDWLTFDASVVRGLAYYTGVVFEGFDRCGKLRAICGGGRYDELLDSFGGESIPACGFGFGDAVIIELLKEKNLLPDLKKSSVGSLVFAFEESLQAAATSVATLLRKGGVSADLVLEGKKMKWAYKHADRRGARFVCLVAPEEWRDGKVSIKDMDTGVSSSLDLGQLVSYIKQRI